MSNCAVVHGSLTTRGGAERVAEQIAETLNAPLYLGFSNKKCLTNKNVLYKTLFNSKIAEICNKRGAIRDLYHFWNWQYRPELTKYDTLIISGNEASWYVPPENQTIIRYIHHPPHTAYDYHYKRASNPLTKIYTLAVRTLLYHTIPFTDKYISNSEIVAKRIKKYWNVESEVIYPPINLSEYTVNEHSNRDDYYLILSRLVPRKRVDSVIKIFNKYPNKSLIIAGEGSERKKLEKQSNENISFKGYVSEKKKRILLQNANALIMPSINEDFGIVPVEAMASGTPVIGVNEGFTANHINHNKNGILYENSELNSVIQNYTIDKINYDSYEIRKSVEKYDISIFKNKINKIVKNI